MDIEQLIALANFLDESGAIEEADRIDALIKGAADPEDDVVNNPAASEANMLQYQRDMDKRVAESLDKFENVLIDFRNNVRYLKDWVPEELESMASQLDELSNNTLVAIDDYLVKHNKTAGLFDKLSDIADRLDSLGASAEADMVDAFIAKHAAKKKEAPAPTAEAPVSKADQVLDVKPEADTEQSKRYDAEHHHSLQVREPKSQKERMDLEGYKDTHHVHTYQPVKEAMEKEAASTRYCPEHVGVSLGRVGEATYQCPLDGKTYNWEVGFTDYDGKHHEGGSVAAQTPDSSGYEIPHRIFDSRENILNRVN